MRCRGCRYYLSLTERDRGQRYCNGCECRAFVRLITAMRELGPAEVEAGLAQ